MRAKNVTRGKVELTLIRRYKMSNISVFMFHYNLVSTRCAFFRPAEELG